jgi:hypothetical protein
LMRKLEKPSIVDKVVTVTDVVSAQDVVNSIAKSAQTTVIRDWHVFVNTQDLVKSVFTPLFINTGNSVDDDTAFVQSERVYNVFVIENVAIELADSFANVAVHRVAIYIGASQLPSRVFHVK